MFFIFQFSPNLFFCSTFPLTPFPPSPLCYHNVLWKDHYGLSLKLAAHLQDGVI